MASGAAYAAQQTHAAGREGGLLGYALLPPLGAELPPMQQVAADDSAPHHKGQPQR